MRRVFCRLAGLNSIAEMASLGGFLISKSPLRFAGATTGILENLPAPLHMFWKFIRNDT